MDISDFDRKIIYTLHFGVIELFIINFKDYHIITCQIYYHWCQMAQLHPAIWVNQYTEE